MDLNSEDCNCSNGSTVNDSTNNFEEASDSGEEEKLKMEKEEEKRLEEKNTKELAKLRRKYEMEQHDKEMKEAGYKRLMHLLEKSQFYAKYLEKRVEKSLQEMATEKKRKFEIDNYTEAWNEVSKKQKLDPSLTSNKEVYITKKVAGEERTEESNRKVSLADIKVDIPQPSLLEGITLRDYQLQGFTWLKLLFETGMSGILADEMGLGKTVQVIALLCHLYEKQVAGPFLIVAPLSTLPNWLIEFNHFAPQVPVVLYYGTIAERKNLRSQLIARTKIMGTNCMPVVLTSYETPIRDNYLKKLKWKYVIVDEGHRLKNYKSLLARTLKQFVTVNRLLMTGTPLQNNLTELWSLLHFLLPEIFDTLEAFQTWFQVEEIEAASGNDQLLKQHDQIIAVLQEILSPFLLRREKKDVNLQLPRKKEVLVYCPLTDIQHKLYSSTVDKTIFIKSKESFQDLIIPENPDGTKQKRFSKLRKNTNENTYKSSNNTESENELVVAMDGEDQYSFNLKKQNIQFMLRKIVNHPYLVQKPVLPGSNIMRINEKLITSSGKLVILDGLLERLKAQGHKVLLFSTMTKLLDLIEEFVIMRNYDYERLDGNCFIEQRKSSIKRFNSEKDVFIFLISTRAGGLGINLMAADTVVIFDSDWNPQADLQAQDRCHRIGQTKPVIVYRFVTAGTVDERIYARAVAKRKLERIIIQEGRFKNLPGLKEKTTNLQELQKLLNEKQYSMEMKSNGSVLTDGQWKELLDRSDLIGIQNTPPKKQL